MNPFFDSFRSWLFEEQRKALDELKHYWEEAIRTLNRIEQLISRPNEAPLAELPGLWYRLSYMVLRGMGRAP